jgi:hypothetical protein
MVHLVLTRRAGSMADLPPPRVLQAEIPHRLRWSSEASSFLYCTHFGGQGSLMYRILLTGNLGFLIRVVDRGSNIHDYSSHATLAHVLRRVRSPRSDYRSRGMIILVGHWQVLHMLRISPCERLNLQ